MSQSKNGLKSRSNETPFRAGRKKYADNLLEFLDNCELISINCVTHMKISP